MADERWTAYGTALRRAIRTAGRSQKQVAAAVYTSESNLSEIIAGRRLPNPELAAKLAAELGLAARDLPELYALARDASSPSPARPASPGPAPAGSSTAGPPAPDSPRQLPPELANLLRRMRVFANELPYAQPRQHRLSLSSVYVRQSVSSPVDVRRVWDPELDEPAMVEEDRRVSGLAQPFDEVINQHDHLVIEGAAGLGKSTLGRHLVGELAAALLDPDADSAPAGFLVPVMVPARTLAAHLDRSWADALMAAVVAEYGGLDDGAVPASAFTETVGDLRWLVVVDALDEIPEPADRERLLAALVARMASSGPARFLVTSRPLSPGEIARLQGPRVGFFELQPFDWAALEQFAQRRFDPDGTTGGALEAARFLRQVRDAGLEQVLVVPLLATVAARVFQDRRDRREQSLPSSRYALYDEYIGQFAAARDATAAGVFGTRCDPALAGWLDAHRTELLERLAVDYTTSETPLLEVARDFLAGSAPLPDRLPADWDDLVCDWLARTGLLGRHGVRLRFLHQTFAEHLAATAHARALPEVFDPEHPLWAELITRFLLGEEAAARVLLHYLHLRGAGAGPLAYLQGRSQDERKQAGSLIAQGAPCTDPELDGYLTLVERQTFAGTEVDFGSLAGLTRGAAVRDRLLALLRHGRVGADAKVRIVDVLRDRSIEARHEGGELLKSLVTDVRQPPERRRAAAEVLARLGAEDRPLVVQILHEIAADPALPADDRRQAAETLATLGGQHRAEAAELLFAVASDAGAIHWQRREAAEELAKLGDGPKTQAADLLYGLATDRTVTAYYRRQYAQTLAKLGGDCRGQAIDAMRQLSRDVTEWGEAGRLFALVGAAELEPDGRDRAAELLHTIAADPLAEPAYLAREALQELARYGGDHRARAARLSHQKSTDPIVEPYDRLALAQDLGKLGARFRDLAVDTFTRLANDLSADESIRIQAARELGRFGPEPRIAAARALRQLVTTGITGLSTRFEAAQELAKLDRDEREWVQGHFRDTFGDPSLAPEDRLLAAVLTGVLEPDTRPRLPKLVHQLALTSASGEARKLAVDFLVGLGPAHLDRAIEILRSSVFDPTRHAGERSVAAQRLAQLDNQHRNEAIDALTELAADPTLDDSYDRFVWSIGPILALDSGRRGWGAMMLYNLATEPGLDSWSRWYAATRLAESGAAHAARAAEALRRLVTDPHTNTVERIRAAAELACFTSERRHAASALVRVVLEPDASIAVRGNAAATLIQIGASNAEHAAAALRRAVNTRDQRAALLLTYVDALLSGDEAPLIQAIRNILTRPGTEAQALQDAYALLEQSRTRNRTFVVEAYERAVTDAQLPHFRRRWAARGLVRLGGAYRAPGLDVLTELALDPAAGFHLRQGSADTLANFGGVHLDTAVKALRALVAAPEIVLERRIETASLLIRRTVPDTVTDLLREMVIDPLLPVDGRCRAAELCVQAGPSWGSIVREWAEDRIGDRFATVEDRVAATFLIGWLRPESRALTLCLLRTMADAPGAGSQLPIAETMLDLPGDGLVPAVELLSRIATDPGEDDDRLAAVQRWTRLGGGQRSAAVAALHELAADPTIKASLRVRALEWQALFGPEPRRLAAATLYALGTDPFVNWQDRLDALNAVARFEPDRRPAVAAALHALVGDPAQPVELRCTAAAQVARFSDADRQRGTEELLAATAEPSARPAQRRRAAEATLGFGGPRRDDALTVLAELAADDDAPGDERALALAHLAWAGHAPPERAIEALRAAATDPALAFPQRRSAAYGLGKFDGADWDCRTAILAQLAADRAIDPADRRAAAADLLRYGAAAQEAGRRLLTGLSVDEDLDPDQRIGAAADLTKFGPEGIELAVSLLTRLAETPEPTDDGHRVAAAQELLPLGTAARRTAATVLARVADPAGGAEQTTGMNVAPVADEVWVRLAALHELARLEPEARRGAADVLLRLAGESTVERLPRALALAMLTGIDARHHVDSVELLTAIGSGRADEPGWERLRAIETLLRLSPDHARRGRDLLRALAADVHLRVWLRRQAAELLAAFGRKRRTEAGLLLANFAADAEADPWERAESAVALAELDPDHRSLAVDVLRGLVTSADHPADQARYAASLLAPFGPQARPVVVEALHRIASDATVDGRERGRAANALLSLGANATADGLDLLSRLGADPDLSRLDRALALGRLAVACTGRLPEAFQTLTDVARDEGEAVGIRRHAARVLTRLGHPAHAATGATVLRAITADPEVEPYERAMAWHVLADHDYSEFHHAARALGRLDLTALEPTERRHAAEAVAGRCPSAWPDAVAVLRRLADDPASTATDRRRSSAALARVLGEAGRVKPSLDPGIRP